MFPLKKVWRKKLKLQEIFKSEIDLDESKKDKSILAKLRFSWGKADWKNKNDRTYPHKIFKSAVEKFNAKIQRGIPGMADHPTLGATKLSGISHLLTKVWLDDNKIAWAEGDLLNTTKGRDVLTILKSGTKIGASLRGYGSTDKAGMVKDDLELNSVDLVVDPSFEQYASVSQANIIESTILEPKVEKLSIGEQRGYDGAINSGYRGSSQEYLQLTKKRREEILESEIRRFKEARQSGYRKSFLEWKNRKK